VRNVRESIRQAFLVHMVEQQRQFGGWTLAARRPPERESVGDVEKSIRQQQHIGNHDKPDSETAGADQHGGTRAGAENVEPKKR
jgi:hypothetical protein